LRKIIFATAVYFAMVSGAMAVPRGICPTLAEGHWVITSFRPYYGAALSGDEAKAYISKDIFISGGRLSFDGRSCQGAKRTVRYSTGEADSEPGFPYVVEYECPGGDNSLMPGLIMNKSCDKALIVIEGVTFNLRKKR